MEQVVDSILINKSITVLTVVLYQDDVTNDAVPAEVDETLSHNVQPVDVLETLFLDRY